MDGPDDGAERDEWLETMQSGGDPFVPPASSLPPPPTRPPDAAPAPPARLAPPSPTPPSGLPHGVEARPSAKSIDVVARMLMVGIGVQTAIALFSANAIWHRADVLRGFSERLRTGIRQIEDADNRVIFSNLAHLATYAIVGVIFLVWFWGAYRNLAARATTKFTNDWAIGAWSRLFHGVAGIPLLILVWAITAAGRDAREPAETAS